MGHNITAIVLQGEYNIQTAQEYDLRGISLEHGLTLFHINHYYTACRTIWNAMATWPMNWVCNCPVCGIFPTLPMV